MKKFEEQPRLFNIQSIEMRQQIYEFVREFPGLHFREIKRRINLSIGALQYHLAQLAEDKLIVGVKDGEYLRYYTVGAVTQKDRFYLQFLRQTPIRRMVLYLLEKKRANHKSLATVSGVSLATTSWYLGKLLDAKIVQKKKTGREVFYTVADPKGLGRTLVSYNASFLDKMVERFASIWEK